MKSDCRSKFFKLKEGNSNMGENKIESMTDFTIEKIKSMIDVDSIIGKPIVSESGVTIIPVSKVMYGFACGGSDFVSKKDNTKDLFGGGGGSGVTIQPVAFLVITADDVKLLQIESFSSYIDRIIAMIPDIADKVKKIIKNRRTKCGGDEKK
jgi:sporulation protein YtfJ